jgi:glutaryl-CoA dehydrogenase
MHTGGEEITDDPPEARMTTTTAAPPATLASDFYGVQTELSPDEQERVLTIREFLEREVRPIADDCWDRAEFPHHLIPGLADLGLFGAHLPETARFENGMLYRGWVALELARVDPSIATFVGVQTGLTMTAIAGGGSPEQRERWLPPMGRGEVMGLPSRTPGPTPRAACARRPSVAARRGSCTGPSAGSATRRSRT